MRHKKNRVSRLVTSALAIMFLLAGTMLVCGAGDRTDPLITMSYLNQTVVPAILTEVENKTQDYQQQLVDKLDEAVRDYSAKMEAALAAQQGSAGKSSTYAVVTLNKDQQLDMDIGGEVMLRIGTAQCISPSAPGLIDMTSGSGVNNGAALKVNHLCMATIAGRSVKATANTVKLLVRGGYTIH